jgi:hypothetical protein
VVTEATEVTAALAALIPEETAKSQPVVQAVYPPAETEVHLPVEREVHLLVEQVLLVATVLLGEREVRLAVLRIRPTLVLADDADSIRSVVFSAVAVLAMTYA